MNINEKGVDFIVSEETGGRKYYEKVYKSTFCWPKGASGCTAMVGIDVGYYTSAEVTDIFGRLVSSSDLQLIQGARGLKSEAAHAYLPKLQHIKFPWEVCLETFRTKTMPKFIALAEKTYPGISELCPDSQTAILSLIFNRGTLLTGSSRVEMANLRHLIPRKAYIEMARELRHMKRLWDPSNGLVERREREAKLISSCA